jgi:outer membrane protein assembly factor BamB
MNWTFAAYTPYSFETPYEANGNGIYSFHAAGVVADGMVYTFNTEHTPSEPLTRGWKLWCLNATTGQVIWNITNGEGVPGSRYFMGAISDGYLAFMDEYDLELYVYGMGLSATTVTAPDIAVPLGTPMDIRGTVMDMSPGNLGTTTNPTAPASSTTKPGTVPCVSDASMETEMEYLYMQLPINGISGNVTMTGVPVTLSAAGSDGTVYKIGTVTTDAYQGTFSCAWTPPKPDTYTITATFAGDDSYGSSSAATSAIVINTTTSTPVPTATATPLAVVTTSDMMTYMVTGVIAIIIAIAIVGVLLLRKRL